MESLSPHPKWECHKTHNYRYNQRSTTKKTRICRAAVFKKKKIPNCAIHDTSCRNRHETKHSVRSLRSKIADMPRLETGVSSPLSKHSASKDTDNQHSTVRQSRDTMDTNRRNRRETKKHCSELCVIAHLTMKEAQHFGLLHPASATHSALTTSRAYPPNLRRHPHPKKKKHPF